MNTRIRNVVATLVLMTAIVFGLIQLNMPVVRATGCPNAGAVGCDCHFLYSESAEEPNGHITWWCHYSCVVCGSGGGGDPMYIEQVVEVHE